jgi:RND family efflux transporter MFP subunit
MMLPRTRWTLAAVAAIAAIAVFTWRGSRPEPVAVVDIRAGNAERVLAITGRTRPRVTVTIMPKIAGQIIELTREEGEHVEAGELLARLDADAARAAVEQDESASAWQQRAVTEAERNLARSRQLRELGLTPQKELDQAQFDLDQARAELTRRAASMRESRSRLADATIRAPVSGVVLSRPVDRGQVVGAQATIYEIAPLADVEVEADVDEQYLGELRDGLAAEVLIAGRAGKIPATLYYVAPKVDPRTGGAKVRLRLNQPADNLRTGVTADVNLIIERRANAVTLARSAILGREADARVLVVADSRVEQRPVRYQEWPSERVIIEAGLEPGDAVIEQPRPDLVGARVQALRGGPPDAALAQRPAHRGQRAL